MHEDAAVQSVGVSAHEHSGRVMNKNHFIKISENLISCIFLNSAAMDESIVK